MMQDFSSKDDALEYAAQLIEETDISDLRGVWAKRKRDREDAELRLKASEEVRRRCAEHIRAMKNRPDQTPEGILREIIEEGDGTHAAFRLHRAWPLAWKGWVNIEATMKCNSNSYPPETTYRILLTDEGRAVLARTDAVTAQSASHQDREG